MGVGGQVLLSVLRAEDCQQVEAFCCANHGDSPALSAQMVIREAPAAIASKDYCFDGEVVVAHDQDEIVGVAVYGLEKAGVDYVTIFSIGVILHRQREGVGTRLKRGVMAETALRDGWPTNIVSQVHRRNHKMLGLNDKLGVRRSKDPGDGDYFMCAIAVTREP